MSVAMVIAERFAKSLDAEDYQTAVALLHEECEYTCRDQKHSGPSAIIESYESTGDSANRVFDNIEYESAVEGIADNVALIHFTDHLYHKEQRFTFKCQQVVEVGGDGRIKRIEHIDLPGQREALSEFMRRIDTSIS